MSPILPVLPRYVIEVLPQCRLPLWCYDTTCSSEYSVKQHGPAVPKSQIDHSMADSIDNGPYHRPVRQGRPVIVREAGRQNGTLVIIL